VLKQFEQPNAGPVWINPTHVTHVEALHGGRSPDTSIVYVAGREHGIIVTGPLQNVAAIINSGR
jgi:hypothetical protein